MTALAKRLRMAWRYQTLPWRIPHNAVKYLGGRGGVTSPDIERGEELARKHGWQ